MHPICFNCTVLISELYRGKWPFFFNSSKNCCSRLSSCIFFVYQSTGNINPRKRYFRAQLLSLSEWTQKVSSTNHTLFANCALGDANALAPPATATLASEFSIPLGINCPTIFVCLRSCHRPAFNGRDEKRPPGVCQVNAPVCWNFHRIHTLLIHIRVRYIERETIDPPPVYHSERELLLWLYQQPRVALNQQLCAPWNETGSRKKTRQAHHTPQVTVDRSIPLNLRSAPTDAHHVADCVLFYHRAEGAGVKYLFIMGRLRILVVGECEIDWGLGKQGWKRMKTDLPTSYSRCFNGTLLALFMVWMLAVWYLFHINVLFYFLYGLKF